MLKLQLYLVDLTDRDIAAVVEIRSEAVVVILSDYKLHVINITDHARYRLVLAESLKEAALELFSTT